MKNCVFAQSIGGAAHWAMLASLIQTCKLFGVEPRTISAKHRLNRHGLLKRIGLHDLLPPGPNRPSQLSKPWPEDDAYREPSGSRDALTLTFAFRSRHRRDRPGLPVISREQARCLLLYCSLKADQPNSPIQTA